MNLTLSLCVCVYVQRCMCSCVRVCLCERLERAGNLWIARSYGRSFFRSFFLCPLFDSRFPPPYRPIISPVNHRFPSLLHLPQAKHCVLSLSLSPAHMFDGRKGEKVQGTGAAGKARAGRRPEERRITCRALIADTLENENQRKATESTAEERTAEEERVVPFRASDSFILLLITHTLTYTVDDSLQTFTGSIDITETYDQRRRGRELGRYGGVEQVLEPGVSMMMYIPSRPEIQFSLVSLTSGVDVPAPNSYSEQRFLPSFPGSGVQSDKKKTRTFLTGKHKHFLHIREPHESALRTTREKRRILFLTLLFAFTCLNFALSFFGSLVTTATKT